MPNRHFGNIGDVWTHLALAEVLAVERPARYWETHSDRAAYVIERGTSPERDFGAWHFHDHAARSPALAASQYGGLLRELMAVDEPLCPASPLIAMRLLGHHNGTHFLFCNSDFDPGTLDDIAHHARRLDIPPARLDTRDEDGGAVVMRAAAEVPVGERGDVLVHIDSHHPLDGSADGAPAGAFAALAAEGFKAVLSWFVVGTAGEFPEMPPMQRVAAYAAGAKPGRCWGGEITVAAPEAGLGACGILCANLSADATSRCRTLGLALAELYPDVTFRETMGAA